MYKYLIGRSERESATSISKSTLSSLKEEKIISGLKERGYGDEFWSIEAGGGKVEIGKRVIISRIH